LRITARYYGFFSTVTKKLFEQLNVAENITVGDLIEMLAGLYGYKFRDLCFIRPLYSERDYINVNVNTLDLNNVKKFPAGLDTPLREGDTVSFGPVGGAA